MSDGVFQADYPSREEKRLNDDNAKLGEIIAEQHDEIKRLRTDLMAARMIDEEQRNRIEELEKQNDERLKIWNESITITTEQIDLLWSMVNSAPDYLKRVMLEVLKKALGIVRCERDECEGGMYIAGTHTPQAGVSECPSCNGHGWRRR